MIFDSHCHLQFPQYDEDRAEMLGRAREADIGLICVGTDLETSKTGIELAQKHDNIWATVGVHPNDINTVNKVESYKVHKVNKSESELYKLYELEKLLTQPKVVAIGEVGLDYYRTSELEKREEQKKSFEQFIDLAVKHNKPLILHSRDAGKGSTGKVHSDMTEILTKSKLCLIHDRVLDTMQKMDSAKGTTGEAHRDLLNIPNTKYNIQNTKLCGVAHSFTGSINDAKQYLNLGFYLGFNGILTFTSQYDDVVKFVPLDRILLETDAPFLSPEPYRGKRNEPAYVIQVAKKIAELKNELLEKVIEITTRNCQKLFNLVA